MPAKPSINEPFNPFIAEYLCQRLASLSPDEYKSLNDSERASIYRTGKIKKFVKQKSIFTILNVLTKIGINWGLYIIDKSFDLQKFVEIYDDKSFVQRSNGIMNALREQKSFITDSKQFSNILTMITNASHGKAALWDRRYIEFSEHVSKKTKDNFDNYDILNEEVEYKKTSEGTRMLLQLFGNLPKLSRECKRNGITLTQFCILCKLRVYPDNYMSIDLISKDLGYNANKLVRELEEKSLINQTIKFYSINTSGILLTGRIFSDLLSNVTLNDNI